MTQNVRGLPEWSEDIGIMRDNYNYDENANVTSLLDWREGVSNRAMEYDALDRLTRVNAPAMWGDAYYGYDALDNLVSANLLAGPTARTTTHSFDPGSNRLTNITSTNAAYSFGIGYDARGNVTQRGSQSFVFDQANRLTSATGKGSYAYDGFGRRVSTVGADGVNRVTAYSQVGQLLFARPTTIALAAGTKYIHLRSHMIAESSPAGTTYMHTDGLGSPVAITNSSGGLVSRTRYEPYGLTASGATPTIGFTGHLNAPEIGLVYMQQRYYDPVAGRFLSIDPVTTDANTGGSFNRYAYANNSPYKYVDPDGRLAHLAAGFFIGLAIETSLQLVQSGEITNPAAILGAGTAGAISGGVGSVLSLTAARGATSAAVATVRTMQVGAAAGVVGKQVEGAVSGKAPTGKELTAAAVGGAVGGLIGGQLSNAPIAALEKQAARAGIPGTVGTTTLTAAQLGGRAAVTTSGTSEGAKIATEASISIIDKTKSN